MSELLVIAPVFLTVVAIVDQLRRLFAHMSLNRTIRAALETHPESVDQLIAKLEPASTAISGVFGWLIIGLAGLGALSLMLDGGFAGNDVVLALIGFFVLGVALVFWDWRNRKATRTHASSSMSQ